MGKYDVQDTLRKPYLAEAEVWGQLPLARRIASRRLSTSWLNEPGLTETHYTATAEELDTADLQRLAALGHKVTLTAENGTIHIEIER